MGASADGEEGGCRSAGGGGGRGGELRELLGVWGVGCGVWVEVRYTEVYGWTHSYSTKMSRYAT